MVIPAQIKFIFFFLDEINSCKVERLKNHKKLNEMEEDDENEIPNVILYVSEHRRTEDIDRLNDTRP